MEARRGMAMLALTGLILFPACSRSEVESLRRQVADQQSQLADQQSQLETLQAKMQSLKAKVAEIPGCLGEVVALGRALALAIAAPPGAAAPVKIPVAAHMADWVETAPGEMNQVKGTWQFRGGQGQQFYEGDQYLQGTTDITYNFQQWTCARRTTGVLWGTIRWEPKAFDGGWKGTFAHHITSLDEYGFSYSGMVQAKGYGELEGTRLMLDVVTDGTVPPLEGGVTVTGFVLVYS